MLASVSMRDFVVIGLITGACLSALVACGPSLRLEEQSAAYFEHCHAAERDPRASTEELIACWEAWLRHWSDGTTRARSVYAKERIVALMHGTDVVTHDQDLEASEDVEPSPAPPAPRYEHSRHHGSTACDSLCIPAFDRCMTRCSDLEQPKDCRIACESERRVCQLACP
jgi:hypothetical protein